MILWWVGMTSWNTNDLCLRTTRSIPFASQSSTWCHVLKSSRDARVVTPYFFPYKTALALCFLVQGLCSWSLSLCYFILFKCSTTIALGILHLCTRAWTTFKILNQQYLFLKSRSRSSKATLLVLIRLKVSQKEGYTTCIPVSLPLCHTIIETQAEAYGKLQGAIPWGLVFNMGERV